MIGASVAERLNLPINGYVNAGMVGGSQKIPYTENVKFALGGLTFDEQKAAFLALKEQEKAEGHQIDGIFGYSLIKNYVIEIDYPKRMLTFYHPDEYKKPKNTRIIQLSNINETKCRLSGAKF